MQQRSYLPICNAAALLAAAASDVQVLTGGPGCTVQRCAILARGGFAPHLSDDSRTVELCPHTFLSSFCVATEHSV